MALNLAALLQPVSDAEKLDLQFRLLAAILRGQVAPSVTLDELAALITKGFQTMSDNNAQLTSKLAQLQSDVAAEKTVNDSAVTLIQGFGAQLADLKAQLAAAGVTAEQLAAVDALDASVRDSTAALAAAVPQNTPAASSGGDTTPPATPPATDPNAPQGTAVNV